MDGVKAPVAPPPVFAFVALRQFFWRRSDSGKGTPFQGLPLRLANLDMDSVPHYAAHVSFSSPSGARPTPDPEAA